MAEVFPDLVIDACCLINLYAAEKILAPAPPPKSPRPRRKPILPESVKVAKPKPALAFNLHVPARVIQETLYIRKPDEEDETKLVEAFIDLSPSLNKGLLHPCDLQDQAEIDLFIQLARTLDDGEAVSMAIAKTRGWGLASDDRKARRLAGQLGVHVLTTPELVKAWAQNTSATATDLAQVLQNIQAFARFMPHKTMPLHQWWVDAAGKTSK